MYKMNEMTIKLSLAGNRFHNILRLLMFLQIFLSPQVKRCANITNKRGIYELSHKLPNGERLGVLGN